jgi:glycosyltransferase involved in cell wall biosynthesis
MKIVMDIREAQLERVGVAVYCQNIIREFVKADDDFEFVFLASNEMPKLSIEMNNHSVKYIAPSHSSGLIKKIKWYWFLPRLLKKFGADLYFGPFLKLPFSSYPCKTVFTLHDAASITEGELVGNLFMKVKNKYFTSNWVNNVDGIICISKFCKDEFTQIFGESVKKRSTVIYHGLPHELNEPYNVSPDDEIDVINKYTSKKHYLITVGTVYPKKNIERLIEAFSKIKTLDVDLLICGGSGANSESIYTAPTRYKIADRVHFLGRIETSELKILLKNSSAFVFPSLYEGFGIPILEAFSMNVPVISSNATCLPEIAGDSVLYFDPYSVEQISKMIDLILTDTQLVNKLIQKGQERVLSFSWGQSAKLHKEFFIEVLNRSN